jgi:hypothetical protein
VAGSSEAGGIRHLAASDKTDPSARGKAKQSGEPREHRVLDDRRGGREYEQTSVLVPRTGEPIRSDRRGQAAADHESEEARAGRGDDPRIRISRQLLDDPTSGLAALGQRSSQRRAHRRDVRARADPTGGKVFQVLDGRRVRRLESRATHELPPRQRHNR